MQPSVNIAKRINGRKLQKTRKRLFSDEPLCRICNSRGYTEAARELDHILPLHLGGGNEDSNLQPLCYSCHAEKTANERENLAGVASICRHGLRTDSDAGQWACAECYPEFMPKY